MSHGCPEALNMLLALTELDRIISPSRMPFWEDERNLTYLRSLIKEVHRFSPIGSLGKCDFSHGPLSSCNGLAWFFENMYSPGIPHCGTKDDVYDGKIIRKNTIVFPDLPA